MKLLSKFVAAEWLKCPYFLILFIFFPPFYLNFYDFYNGGALALKTFFPILNILFFIFVLSRLRPQVEMLSLHILGGIRSVEMKLFAHYGKQQRTTQ